MKMIKFENCKNCPMALQLTIKGYCSKEGKQIPDMDKIADFCELDDYPKTITEFTDGKI